MAASKYSQYKTDEERLAAMYDVPYIDWMIVADWAEQATTEENRQRFHDRAVSLYHTEEWSAGML